MVGMGGEVGDLATPSFKFLKETFYKNNYKFVQVRQPWFYKSKILRMKTIGFPLHKV